MFIISNDYVQRLFNLSLSTLCAITFYSHMFLHGHIAVNKLTSVQPALSRETLSRYTDKCVHVSA